MRRTRDHAQSGLFEEFYRSLRWFAVIMAIGLFGNLVEQPYLDKKIPSNTATTTKTMAQTIQSRMSIAQSPFAH